MDPAPPPLLKKNSAASLYSPAICVYLFNIAPFFTKVSHDLVQSTSYTLKHHAYREV